MLADEKIKNMDPQMIRSELPKNRRHRSNLLGIGLFLINAVVYFSLFFGIILIENYAVKLILSFMAGGLIGTLFIIGHDAAHNSFVNNHKLNRLICRLAFLPALQPPSSWVLTHNGMHHTWTNLKGYDPVYAPFSKTEFDNLPLWRQILERIYRSALGLALLYFIEIYWKWELFPKKENQPKRRHQFKIDRAIVMLFGLLQILVAMYLSFMLTQSWGTAVITTLLAVLLPYCVWNWVMAFLTFQQHTHPKIAWFDKKEEWNFFLGQVCCTVYIIFPGWINRLLHNIMEHTVHHVDPLIPLYKLPESQNKLIEIYGDKMTIVRWSFPEFLKTLQVCKLYDYETHRWMGFDGSYTSETCTSFNANCSPSLP